MEDPDRVLDSDAAAASGLPTGLTARFGSSIMDDGSHVGGVEGAPRPVSVGSKSLAAANFKIFGLYTFLDMF